MERTVPVSDASEAFLEILNANGVEYLFLNPGTDTFSLQGAVSKYKALGKRCPEVILCLHESVAMAAAHGYFMITGKPQVVVVHADLGPQQVGGALHNAQRGRAGVILCSGKVPADIEAGRLNPVHWLQEQFDQAGVVRGYVKWEYELRSTDSLHQALQRAFQVASSEPCGPVYLSLPQDIMAAKMTRVTIPDISRHPAISANGADDKLLEEIASILLKAEKPLIITSYSGRHTASVPPLVELAEILGAPVVDWPYRLNFPFIHPLYAGLDLNSYLGNADAILVIDHDIPYVPSQIKPRPEANIIQIDIDPLKENLPMWGFPADILLKADSSRVLPALCRIIRQGITPELQARFHDRSQNIQYQNQSLKDKWRDLALSGSKQKPPRMALSLY
jgi:acetolactate synthase I/II/III large subunit